MKWLDVSMILIINKEGIENIFNIDNNFEVIAYNMRPMFNKPLGGYTWDKLQYYRERPCK